MFCAHNIHYGSYAHFALIMNECFAFAYVSVVPIVYDSLLVNLNVLN